MERKQATRGPLLRTEPIGVDERLALPVRLDGGYLLRKFLERHLRPITDHPSVEDVLLSASEAFSNAVRYGTGTSDDEIRIDLWGGSDGCRLSLEYRGEPFSTSPTDLPDADATGGRGRWLMQELCDSVQYEFRDGMTRIVLMKRWS